ncbi:hypothetical protein [Dyadobacter sp. MSC1_007]|jgi:hypothetical protein|uniref:hypothetical protein n=1 Tax=Dyadobacter sp. MSC1_007 TaxID=2909264 RepID=UPI00202F3C8C|nr:hypothetical protein [Dyadobacter sp. MSC1_007]
MKKFLFCPVKTNPSIKRKVGQSLVVTGLESETGQNIFFLFTGKIQNEWVF